jgi:hypothetical protein
VPDNEKERQSHLECLRLASDLRQFADRALSPELREHCLRMAKDWSDRAEASPQDDDGEFVYLDC